MVLSKRRAGNVQNQRPSRRPRSQPGGNRKNHRHHHRRCQETLRTGHRKTPNGNGGIIMDVFDNALNKAKEALEIVSQKTEEVVTLGKQKIELFNIKNSLDTLMNSRKVKQKAK